MSRKSVLCFPKSSSCHGDTKVSELLPSLKAWSPSVLLKEGSPSTRGSTKPSKGCLLARQRGSVRLGHRHVFLFWKLHSISLGKSAVYLHKCLALGFRNYHVDVSSREDAENSEDEKTVSPDGHLEQRGQGAETLQTTYLVPL